jgi:hypothetical protein
MVEKIQFAVAAYFQSLENQQAGDAEAAVEVVDEEPIAEDLQEESTKTEAETAAENEVAEPQPDSSEAEESAVAGDESGEGAPSGSNEDNEDKG